MAYCSVARQRAESASGGRRKSAGYCDRPPGELVLWYVHPGVHPCVQKNRPTTDVLFIDASKTDEAGNPRYIKATNQNELGQEHIDAIVDAYHSRTEQPGFVHVATREEIQENEYNLNIPRYVDTFEEEEVVDIAAVQANIARLKQEIAEAEAKMDVYLKELGL